MFAVPGWSVTADSLKTQVPNTLTGKASKTINGDNESSAKPSKKRKRGKGKAGGLAVNQDNFEDLWKTHIEGKDQSKHDGKEVSAGLAKREMKRRKRGGDSESGATINGTAERTRDVAEGKAQLGEQEDKMAKAKGRKPPSAKGELSSTKSKSTAHPTTTAADPPQPQLTPQIKQTQVPSDTAHLSPAPNSTLTPLQQAMREKLISSRFRYLNETLYTTPSSSSFELFKRNPTFFTEYHEGFRRQVGAWPENPVDGFVMWIRERGAIGIHDSKLGSQKSHFRKIKKGKKAAEDIHEEPEYKKPDAQGIEPLPRDSRSGLCTIADLGCGDAQLAQKLSSPIGATSKGPVMVKSLNLRIHSFDLAAPSPAITVADIRCVPLPDSSLDVATFCLALMGTNWIEFIEEAWRILRWKGECWIGEVGSRFAGSKEHAKRVDHSVGNRTKLKSKSKNNKRDKTRTGTDEEVGEGEDHLAESSQPSSHSSTDVSAFVEVLRTRGFTLIGEPELGNKMFVRMRFLKSLNPTKGKCALKENDPRRSHWRPEGWPNSQRMTESAGERQAWNKPTKFIDRNLGADEGMSISEEGKVLKPCVYKAR